MTTGRQIAGLLGTIVLAGGLALATAIPVPTSREAGAAVRLSWTARPEWIEECRAATEEELARVEVHMRQRVVCEGAAASYRLRISVDDTVVAERVVRGGGLRHDRPMHVLVNQPVAPGLRHLRIELERREVRDSLRGMVPSDLAAVEDTGLFAGRAARELDERSRRAAAAVPPRLRLDTVLQLPAQRVALVRYDPDGRRLELVTDHDD